MVANKGRRLQIRQPSYDAKYKYYYNNLFTPSIYDNPFPTIDPNRKMQTVSYEVPPINSTNIAEQGLEYQQNENIFENNKKKVEANNSRDFSREAEQIKEKISQGHRDDNGEVKRTVVSANNKPSSLTKEQENALDTYVNSWLRLNIPKGEFYGNYNTKEGTATKYWVDGGYIYETKINLNDPLEKNTARVYLATPENLKALQNGYDRINVNRIIKEKNDGRGFLKKIFGLEKTIEKLPDYEIKLTKPVFR